MEAQRIWVFLCLIYCTYSQMSRLTTANSSASLDAVTVYNYVNSNLTNLTNTTTVRPFQFVQQIYSPIGPTRIGFDFGGVSSTGYLQGFPQLAYEKEAQYRVDSVEDFTFNISLSYLSSILTATSKYKFTIEIAYWRRDLKFIYAEVNFWQIPYIDCTEKTEWMLINERKFYYSNISDTNEKYSFNSCFNSSNFNETINFTNINHFLIGKNILRGFDSRKNFKMFFYLEGIGQIYFNHNRNKNYRHQYIFQTTSKFQNYIIYHKTFHKIYYTYQFSNVSVKVDAKNISDVISEYYYEGVYLPRPNSEVTATIGYLNTSWRTPLGAYQFPLSVSRNVAVEVTLTYYQRSTVPSNNSFFIAGCFRNDFNPITKVFTSASIDPISKVVVCFNCSDFYNASDNEIDVRDSTNKPIKVAYRGIVYKARKGNDGITIVYSFYAETKLSSAQKFDFFAFVRYLRDHLNLFTNQSLMMLQAGVKIYNGRGIIFFQDFNVVVSPLSSLNYSSINDVYSYPQKGCLNSLPYTKLNTCVLQDPSSDLISDWLINARGLGLFFRVTAMTSLIDEFIYYTYHNVSYDIGTRIASKLCRNYSSVKWIIPNLFSSLQSEQNDLFSDIGPLIGAGATESNYTRPIIQHSKYAQRLEWPLFIENTYDFWLVTVPLSIFVFAILFTLSVIVQCCLPNKIALFFLKILLPYRSLVHLWSVIIADNLTYLSFKCFLNLQQLLPLSYDGNQKFAYFSEISSIIVLFFLTLTICGICSMAWIFSRKRLGLGTRKTLPGSYLLYTLLITTKFLSGFIHAFVDNQLSRIWSLLCIYLLSFFILFWNYQCIENKVNNICPIILLTAKLVVHFFLLLQILYLNGLISKADNQSSLWVFFAVISIILFFVLMFTNFVYKFQAWIIFDGYEPKKQKKTLPDVKMNKRKFLNHKNKTTKIVNIISDKSNEQTPSLCKSKRKCTFNLTHQSNNYDSNKQGLESSSKTLKKSQWGRQHEQSQNFAKSISMKSRQILQNSRNRIDTFVFQDSNLDFTPSKSAKQLP